MLYDLCVVSSILSFHTFLCLLCSWLWILCAPLGLQNLTLGTKRCSMICASFHSYKSWALLIPGLLYYSIDITCSMLAGNGLGKYNLLIGDSLFLAVDFVRPFRASKSYARNSPIHTSLCVTSFLQRWFTGDPRAPCSYVNSPSNKKRAPFWVLFLY